MLKASLNKEETGKCDWFAFGSGSIASSAL